MSEIDAKYLGLSVIRLAEIATKLERYNTTLREENERLIKLNEIYKESYGKGYRDGQWNMRERHALPMVKTEILEQYSKKRIVEIAMYWYEEAVYCENKYEELQRKFRQWKG